jgi:hypothetical protein
MSRKRQLNGCVHEICIAYLERSNTTNESPLWTFEQRIARRGPWTNGGPRLVPATLAAPYWVGLRWVKWAACVQHKPYTAGLRWIVS